MTTTAATARYARWDGVGEPFRLVDAPLPERPGPGEVLVRVDLATVCGSDLHTTRGHRPSPVPGVLGHEQVGRVVAVGAPALERAAAGGPVAGGPVAGGRVVEVPAAGNPAGGLGPRHVGGAPVRVGDRIVWSVAASCGTCRCCRRGVPQKCTDLRKYGHEPLDEARPLTGGFASHCVLTRGTPTVVVPEAVPDLVAAPASCATATVAAVLDAAGPLGPGDRVVVVGAGMLGVTAVAMAARTGAEVVAADPHAGRRERAMQFGAAAAVEAPPAHAFDMALELSGAPAGVRTCLTSLDIGGTAVLAGSVSPGPAVELDPERLVRGLHTVAGVHNYAPRHLAVAVEFLVAEHDRFPFAGLTGGPWALDELDAAFAAAGAPGAAPRQAVRP